MSWSWFEGRVCFCHHTVCNNLFPLSGAHSVYQLFWAAVTMETRHHTWNKPYHAHKDWALFFPLRTNQRRTGQWCHIFEWHHVKLLNRCILERHVTMVTSSSPTPQHNQWVPQLLASERYYHSNLQTLVTVTSPPSPCPGVTATWLCSLLPLVVLVSCCCWLLSIDWLHVIGYWVLLSIDWLQVIG